MEDHAKAKELFFLAQAARQENRHADAEGYLREAVRLDPSREAIRINLSGALIDQGKHAEALGLCLGLARDFAPHPVSLHRLSLCQFATALPQDALNSIDRCLALAPDNLDALIHKVAICLRLEDADTALAAASYALTLAPQNASLLTGLGMVYTAKRQFELARDAHRQALELAPTSADKRWNLALAQLMLGELSAGWRNMEARWIASDPVENHYTGSAPRWDGRVSPAGRTILVWAEQGLGDSIQCCRFISPLLQEGAKVIFQVPTTLVALMRGLSVPAGAQLSLIAEGDSLPSHDFHVPLMSVPGCLGERLAILPAPAALTLNPDRRDHWHKLLGERRRPRVGLMWQGNLSNLRGLHRSLKIQVLESVLGLPFDFYCVSDVLGEADQAWLKQEKRSVLTFQEHIHDFADTACLISQLDLLITIDTSIAHLGPSLGIPTWVLLPWTADWRWSPSGKVTPWYPQSRLFRQQALGQWQAPIWALRDALCQHFDMRNSAASER